MSAVSFFVPGIPIAQGSKRHVGRGIMVESSKHLKPWRLDVTALAREAHTGPPLEDATVDLIFVFPRPKAHYRTGRNAHLLRPQAPERPIVKPDLDKLCRSVLDSLTAAQAIRDDSTVTGLTARKRYGDLPGVHVHLATRRLLARQDAA